MALTPRRRGHPWVGNTGGDRRHQTPAANTVARAPLRRCRRPSTGHSEQRSEPYDGTDKHLITRLMIWIRCLYCKKNYRSHCTTNKNSNAVSAAGCGTSVSYINTAIVLHYGGVFYMLTDHLLKLRIDFVLTSSILCSYCLKIYQEMVRSGTLRQWILAN